MPLPPNRERRWCVVCSLLLAVICQACAHPGHGRDLRQAEDLPESIVLDTVPFFPQEAYQCGPAAMAMVLGWSGLSVEPDDLVEEIYTPGRKGSLQPSLVAAARRRGRLAYTFNGPQPLLAELAAGHPVIVLQNLGTATFPAWHYAVVVGLNRLEQEIVLHSGTVAHRPMAWSRFLFTWERGRYWGLVVLPAGRIPSSAEEESYLEVVLGLEQAGQWEAAARAYAAALDRWPESLPALIGLGNCQVRVGNLPAAEAALRQAVSQSPANSDAANNLAHVLSRLGKLEEAHDWARRAVQSGGPNRSIYLETFQEIEDLRQSKGGERP